MISEKLVKATNPYVPSGEPMEFKLTYEGRLLGSSRTNSRADHKHDIRREFHPQLKRLWELTDALGKRTFDRPNTPEDKRHMGIPEYQIAMSEALGDQYTRNGYRFCPLVTKSMSMHCSVNILFLRPEPPGQVLRSGDIDGRIKTVFDALRMPENLYELAENSPQEGENPFYCLLEDDKLISNLALETATMLQPVKDSYEANDCRLVISVKIWLRQIGIGNLDFMAF